jgi:hypothetical protein
MEKTFEEIGSNLKEYKRKYYQENKERIKQHKKKFYKNRKIVFKERVPYSKEELELIYNKKKLGRSYTQIASICNRTFHNGRNVRNEKALWAYLSRCERLKKIGKDINNTYCGMEFV